MSSTVATRERAPASTTNRRPRKPVTHASAAETRALLAASLGYRQQRLEADDMLSTDAAAERVGVTRVTMNAWVAKGRAIGLTQTKRGLRMPAWQFEPRLWGVLPALIAALGTPEGWAVLAFLESPHGALDGITPRQAIEQGEAERVMAIAAQEGH